MKGKDMSNVITIEPVVTHRCCPGCGYLMAQIEIDMLRASVKCPRGCDKTINDFQPMRYTHSN